MICYGELFGFSVYHDHIQLHFRPKNEAKFFPTIDDYSLFHRFVSEFGYHCDVIISVNILVNINDKENKVIDYISFT